MSTPPAGSGYFISPTDGPGPGVLYLHSWRGLDRSAKDNANRLADAGFTVLAPDLADGETWTEDDAALDALGSADINVTASLVQSAVGILKRATADPDRPIGIVGFGSGASWALWLSARFVDDVSTVVTYYGSQSISMDGANAKYLCHWAADDTVTTDDDIANLGLSLQLARREFRFESHLGATAGFAEPASDKFEAAADQTAWKMTTDFLTAGLATP